jgi:hypothetical protein
MKSPAFFTNRALKTPMRSVSARYSITQMPVFNSIDFSKAQRKGFHRLIQEWLDNNLHFPSAANIWDIFMTNPHKLYFSIAIALRKKSHGK